MCETNYGKETLTFTISPSFQFNSWLTVENSNGVKWELQHPNCDMSRRLRKARYDLIEGVNIKIGAPDTTDEAQKWAVFSKAQQVAGHFKKVLSGKAANNLAFNKSKWGVSSNSTRATVYQDTPAPKRFHIDTTEEFDNKWNMREENLRNLMHGATIMVAWPPFSYLYNMRNVGIFHKGLPSNNYYAHVVRSVMEAPLGKQDSRFDFVCKAFEKDSEEEIWDMRGPTANCKPSNSLTP